MTDYTDIIRRLTEAEGPSRELDASVAQAAGGAIRWSVGPTETRYQVLWPWDDMPSQGDDIDDLTDVPCLTSSLDASIALCERMLPEWHPSVGRNVHHHYWYASVLRVMHDGLIDARSGDHKTSPSIALCLAMFRALAQSKAGE